MPMWSASHGPHALRNARISLSERLNSSKLATSSRRVHKDATYSVVADALFIGTSKRPCLWSFQRETASCLANRDFYPCFHHRHDLHNGSSLWKRDKRSASPCPAPLRVTNEGREVRVKELLEDAGMTEDADYVVLDPFNPPPDPQLGPLEQRVSLAFEEALEQDIVDEEAMRWWFTEPESGWLTEKRRMKKAKTSSVEMFDSVRYDGSDLEGRRPLAGLKVGDTLVGTVKKHMLYHGIQVDVGAEVDGLIWVSELESWQALGAIAEHDGPFDIDSRVEVRVHAVREDPLYRFPLQLMPFDADIASKFPNPDGHVPPLDLREIPLAEYKAVANRTGRVWSPKKVIVPMDTSSSIIEPTDDEDDGWFLDEGLEWIDDAAAGIGR